MSATQVILLERIEALGQMGDVVKVKPGFARNFLLPQKKAMRATKENLAYFEKQRAQLEVQNLSRKADAEKVAEKMGVMSVVIIRQAGETGQLYGSVSNRDVAMAITAAGYTADRRQVLLQEPIKTLGIHSTRLALHPEVTIEVRVNVAQSEDEAKAQAAAKAPAPVAQPAATEAAPEGEAVAALPEAQADVPVAKPKGKKAKAEKSAEA